MKHLIHIGYPRTASTYLRYYFSESPFFVHQMRAVSGFYKSTDFSQYSYQPKKEAKYFVLSEEELACWSGPAINLSSLNRGYDVATHRKALLSTLKNFYGNPTILIITRGFSAIIKSLYAQYVNYGGRLGPESFILSPNGESLKELLNYTAVINDYRLSFGEENVLTLPYEWMRDNRKEFMARLCTLLSVPYHEGKDEKVNESPSTSKLNRQLKLSSAVYKLLALTGSKREQLYNLYAYSLMNGKFDWALPLTPLGRDKNTIEEAWESDLFKNYLQTFRGKGSVFIENPNYRVYQEEYLNHPA